MTDGVANLFIHRSAAQRYAAARPYFHPIVAARILAFADAPRFGRALDVACGTGQSARAIADIADEVDATDISPEMVAEATPHDRVRYHIGPAERLSFSDKQFDLVTVGLAFHWFDQAKFLGEAARVLKPDGWLVGYNNGFNGEMSENTEFRQWAWEVYPKRFPTPPRRGQGVSEELISPHGFHLAGTEKFANEELMTAEQLTAYLLTQTNVISAVESGITPLAEAAAWIEMGVTPFFEGRRGTMKFSGTIWFMRRMAAK
jgi:SAM-dependent methyltransferase